MTESEQNREARSTDERDSLKSQPIAVDIDVHSVKKMLESGEPFLLLDCREPSEFETCRIEGATLIPMKQISKSTDKLAEHAEMPIVVY